MDIINKIYWKQNFLSVILKKTSVLEVNNKLMFRRKGMNERFKDFKERTREEN